MDSGHKHSLTFLLEFILVALLSIIGWFLWPLRDLTDHPHFAVWLGLSIGGLCLHIIIHLYELCANVPEERQCAYFLAHILLPSVFRVAIGVVTYYVSLDDEDVGRSSSYILVEIPWYRGIRIQLVVHFVGNWLLTLVVEGCCGMNEKQIGYCSM